MVDRGWGHYLEALPPPDSLIWTQFGSQPALVIGKKDDRDVVVSINQQREKPREPRYYLAIDTALGDGELLWTREAVLKMPLFAPFNTIAEGTTMTMKRKLTLLVRWYFLWKGHLDSIDGDLKKFCKILGCVARRIHRDGEDVGPEDDEAEMIEESPEPVSYTHL